MGAGLQGHIGGGAAGLFPGGMQGIDLGMGFTGTLVPALPTTTPAFTSTAPTQGLGAVV